MTINGFKVKPLFFWCDLVTSIFWEFLVVSRIFLHENLKPWVVTWNAKIQNYWNPFDLQTEPEGRSGGQSGARSAEPRPELRPEPSQAPNGFQFFLIFAFHEYHPRFQVFTQNVREYHHKLPKYWWNPGHKIKNKSGLYWNPSLVIFWTNIQPTATIPDQLFDIIACILLGISCSITNRFLADIIDSVRLNDEKQVWFWWFWANF